MSYDKLDKFITDLGQPAEVPAGQGAVGLLALKKLAQVVHEPPRALAPSGEAVRATVRDITACELQKQASGFPNQVHFFSAFLAHLGGQCGPQEKVAGLPNRIALEERSMVLKDKLSHLLGPANTVYPTIRNFISEDQQLIASLRTPPKEKLSARDRLMSRIKKIAQPVVVPPPNSDTPEGYVARERQLAHDQAVRELAHTKMQLNQTAMMAQQSQQETQQAQEQLAQADEQIQMSQGEADAARMESQQHQQQAIEAEGRAAQHATQKMQLGMRVQQMRQTLAEIATQDPVTETAAGANDLAAQGAPATPDQQAQAQEEQAMAEEQAAATPPAEAQKEVQEAENAAQEAEQQATQAQQAMGPAAAPAAPAEAPAGGMAPA